MRARTFVAAILLFALSACASGRGDLVDDALDSTLYHANSKSERLLRYFEIQALLVRFAANTSGGIADRNAVAIANIAATQQFNDLIACLRVGSIYSDRDPASGEFLNAAQAAFEGDPASPLQPANSYCSFFDSRSLAYQETLFGIMRQVTRDDPDAKLLEQTIQGFEVLSFAAIVSNLTQIAGRIIKDELILHAFKRDARELQYLIYQRPGIQGPDAISDNCVDAVPEGCGTVVSTDMPPVLIWHVQEVAAYMKASCVALNGDLPAVKGGPSCSSYLPFPVTRHPPAPAFVPRPGAAIAPLRATTVVPARILRPRPVATPTPVPTPTPTRTPELKQPSLFQQCNAISADALLSSTAKKAKMDQLHCPI